jgi:hypothetical protein
VVDYEGALPETTLSDNPDESAIRTAVISVPDSEAPLNLSSIETGVTGETADGYDYTQRCSG